MAGERALFVLGLSCMNVVRGFAAVVKVVNAVQMIRRQEWADEAKLGRRSYDANLWFDS